MRRRRASAISPRGRRGEGASTNRNVHLRLEDNGTPSVLGTVARNERGANSRGSRGGGEPITERAPTVEEVFRESSVLDDGYTGLGFVERGLTSRNRNALEELSPNEIASHFYRESARVSWTLQ
ncbi:hypothetical protein U1Q18_052687 [Sarracenia purpurea var. burkii]